MKLIDQWDERGEQSRIVAGCKARTWRHIMRKFLVALASWSFSLMVSVVPVNAQDASTRDLECFASMQGPETSSDEKTRWGAAAAATFYLGRLDQMGLTL